MKIVTIRPLHTFNVRHVFGEWVVYIRDPQGRPLAHYNGFDGQLDAEEWAANVCAAMDRSLMEKRL